MEALDGVDGLIFDGACTSTRTWGRLKGNFGNGQALLFIHVLGIGSGHNEQAAAGAPRESGKALLPYRLTRALGLMDILKRARRFSRCSVGIFEKLYL